MWVQNLYNLKNGSNNLWKSVLMAENFCFIGKAPLCMCPKITKIDQND